MYEGTEKRKKSIEAHQIIKSQHESNIIFMSSLQREWKFTIYVVKSYERVDVYTITYFFDILKSHEEDILDAKKEKKSFGGPLAFVSKEETTKQVISNEDHVLFVNKKAKSSIRKFHRNFVIVTQMVIGM